jgi:hypothetical protein
VLYGHHMSGDAMFGKLDAYLDAGYLETHAYGTLTETDGTEHPFRLFALTRGGNWSIVKRISGSST